jgi:uncharacterized integral membrane protein
MGCAAKRVLFRHRGRLCQKHASEKAKQMVQLILATVLTIVVVAFSMSNAHHVQLSYAFGRPIEVRLIFLLLCTYLAGAATAYFYHMIRRVQRDAQRRKQRLVAKRRQLMEAEAEVD